MARQPWLITYAALGAACAANATLYLVEWVTPYNFPAPVRHVLLGSFFVTMAGKMITDYTFGRSRRGNVAVAFDEVNSKVDNVEEKVDIVAEAVIEVRDKMRAKCAEDRGGFDMRGLLRLVRGDPGAS